MWWLSDRSVLAVSGPDARSFLQNLITQDVETLGVGEARFSALLSPQGKYLSAFFVLAIAPDAFLLDVATPETEGLAKRLTLYRLRSKVIIGDVSDNWAVCAGPADAELTKPDGAFAFPDPRLAALRTRLLVRRETVSKIVEGAASYAAHQLSLGVPEPWRDLEAEKDFALEGLFDELNAIDFQKGCYVGQEMTSRMKRRTTVKQKLCLVALDGPLPAFNTPIFADEQEVGKMRSGIDRQAMALIRFDRAAAAAANTIPLHADGKLLTLQPPGWILQPT